MARIPYSVKRKCVELFDSGMTAKDVYEEYYSKMFSTKFTGFESMLKRWRKKSWIDEELLEIGNLGYKFSPHATTVQVNGDGEVVQTWIKSNTEDSMFLQLVENIKSLKPLDPIVKHDKKSEPRMLQIPFTDMHFGIAFLDDYEETLQRTLEKISKEQWEEVNIVMGEDLLHTEDLKGHTSNQTFIGPVDIVRAYNDAITFYSRIIEEALACSDTVNVIYSKGNHSETLSWTIVQVLKALYPQCYYDDEIKDRKIIKFHRVLIGVMHGDKIRGNLKDIKELFVEENLIDYANASVKEVHLAHYHHQKETGDINGCMVRRLPSAVPTDKWHHERGFTMSHKRFQLFEYSWDKLLSIHNV